MLGPVKEIHISDWLRRGDNHDFLGGE